MQWTPSLRGFLGIGLVQQLAGSQNKVNELWTDHQDALHWASSLIIFGPRGANINKHHVRQRGPKYVETDGPIPTYIAPNPASTQGAAGSVSIQRCATCCTEFCRATPSGNCFIHVNAALKSNSAH